MISSTFTALIINHYEARLSAISTVLFACVPMIMGTGGNAGSQVSVTVIRALAVDELTTKDILKVIWKELRASIILGLTLGIACFIKLLLIDNAILQISDYTPIRSIIISIALTLTIIVAKIVGAILPIFAKVCHLDPAVVANPFITTIIDVVSLIIYCSLAITILA
jgi:magnesium transporter